jgi:hypothetical protein
MTKDDETLENLYIEYIVLAEDYVWVDYSIICIVLLDSFIRLKENYLEGYNYE